MLTVEPFKKEAVGCSLSSLAHCQGSRPLAALIHSLVPVLYW